MKLRIGKPSSFVSWIVTAALLTSPLLAQNPPAADVTLSTPDEVSPDAAPQVTKENDQPIVDTSVLLESPGAASGAAVPAVNKSSIPSTPRAESHTSGTSKPSNPGETKWVILAAILTAGAVAAILLLRGGGGDSNHHDSPKSPQGTIIVAGSPSVSNH